MVVIKCRIIAKPRGGTRPIYKKGNDGKGSNKPGVVTYAHCTVIVIK